MNTSSMLDATIATSEPSLNPREDPHTLDWARYVALHEAVRWPLVGAHRLAAYIALLTARRQVEAPDAELPRAVRKRYWDLLATDFENARQGLYPLRLLFDVPLAEYAGNLPRFLYDTPRILARIGARDHRDLPRDVDLSAYPAYYRRTFHWQTDGYLSRHSARLYDLGVELLFVGTADVMRRQVLAEIMRRQRRSALRLLDVGAGTGRFLRQAALSLPGAVLRGVDLSPWYVEHARASLAALSGTPAPQGAWRRLRALLAQRSSVAAGARLGPAGVSHGAPPLAASVQVDVANAEALPFPDQSFDVVTSIFMLHELPRAVRRTVLGEMQRVLAPGGLLVIGDAAQPSDAPELRDALERFSEDMHEPFFADYLEDDLAALLEAQGFAAVRTSPSFFAKVASATKGACPSPPRQVH